MSKYQKWLGAGLGFAVGGPLGGLLGFIAGAVLEEDSPQKVQPQQNTTGISEMELNLMVLGSHLMRVDGRITHDEIAFMRQFLSQHFGEEQMTKRESVMAHCLNHEYDLGMACDRLRMHTEMSTRVQVIHFLFDLAEADKNFTEREQYFIFRVAGYMSINDVQYRNIKETHEQQRYDAYNVLNISRCVSQQEAKATYRKLVLLYHPDKHANLPEAERAAMNKRFQKVQEAWEKICAENGWN